MQEHGILHQCRIFDVVRYVQYPLAQFHELALVLQRRRESHAGQPLRMFGCHAVQFLLYLLEVLGKLPPLRELSRLSLTALKGGLLLTVVGIFLGIIYTEDAGTVFRPTDLKLLLPSLLVVYYGVVVVMRGRISEAIFIRLSAGGMFFAVTSLLVAAIR